MDVQGTSIPVISPEDLIVTKVLAGRSKDIEDVRSVIHERRASLDAERIRTLLGLLEQALGQSDLHHHRTGPLGFLPNFCWTGSDTPFLVEGVRGVPRL